MYKIAALYRFVSIANYKALKPCIESKCTELKLCGTLLLAGEGINGTIAGKPASIDDFLTWLTNESDFASLFDGLEAKFSFSEARPFTRMKVKLKKEIVTMGVSDIDPKHVVGTYVEPKDWNALITDPDVLLIDTRNDYEVEIGSFHNAINPNTSSFRQFPAYVEEQLDPAIHKKVAMFCTGGIRCEKSTALLKQKGFDDVYHLKGGILKYLEEVDPTESLWEGECFVFDSRVAVDHSLKQGSFDQCYGCRFPITDQDKQSSLYVKGISCPRCHSKLSDAQRARFTERQRQIELAKQRGEVHIGGGMAE